MLKSYFGSEKMGYRLLNSVLGESGSRESISFVVSVLFSGSLVRFLILNVLTRLLLSSSLCIVCEFVRIRTETISPSRFARGESTGKIN